MSQDVNITIGGSLKALQWAYQHGTRLIINKPSFPPPYEPSDKKLAWGLLYYKLMMDGNVIGGDNVNAIRVSDDEIVVVCKNNIINKLVYDSITVFNDENITGLPDQIKEIDEHLVTDYMRAISFIFKDTDFKYETTDNLVSKIYIHKDYINSPVQIAVVSNLTKKQLHDFDYSDTMSKFKTESTLKELNFKGSFNNRDNIILEVEKREITAKMNVYEETEKIKFVYE